MEILKQHDPPRQQQHQAAVAVAVARATGNATTMDQHPSMPAPALSSSVHSTVTKHGATTSSSMIRGRLYRSLPTLDGAAVAAVNSATNTPGANVPGTTTVITSSTTTTSRDTAPRWVTREIAALEFLLGIPLENEMEIVRAGLNARIRKEEEDHLHPHPHRKYHVADGTQESETKAHGHHRSNSKHGSDGEGSIPSTSIHLHWWEKIMYKEAAALGTDKARRARLEMEEKQLEQPSAEEVSVDDNGTFATEPTSGAAGGAESLLSRVESQSELASVGTFLATQHVAPGRRLDGREAVFVRPPKVICTIEKLHKGRTVATSSAVREWEVRLAHGIGSDKKDAKGLLDGRAFFSSQQGYPLAVFSVVKYEPKKEEAARRRRKLEEMGGGGTQFFIPERDWRGVSYAALLKKHHKRKRQPKSSDRSSNSSSEDETDSLSSSDESDTYEPGFLDDPAMVSLLIGLANLRCYNILLVRRLMRHFRIFPLSLIGTRSASTSDGW